MNPPALPHPPLAERIASRIGRMPPALLALGAQLAAAAALGLCNAVADAPSAALAPFVHGALAALVGHSLRLPAWWLPLNFAFGPAAVWASRYAVAPGWFLAGFLVLGLLFRSTYRGRVPLFASSSEACRRLVDLLPARSDLRVIDLGCGAGGVLQHLCKARPDISCTGLELAAVPALLAWLRLRGSPDCRVRWKDFWREDLSGYDVVYAFLSPAAMPDLWRKARAEMKRGSLLVSNSFAIEGVAPHAVVRLSGRTSNALLVWRL